MTNLVGRVFGLWTVIGPEDRRHALCRCACGIEINVYVPNMLAGKSNGCRGCGAKRSGAKRKGPPKEKRVRKSRPRIQWAGRSFGDWTIIADDAPVGTPRRKVRCRCSCGTEDDIGLSNLVQGQSTRCRPCAGRKMRPMRTDGGRDLTGEVFGKWRVVADALTNRTTARYVDVICECGRRSAVVVNTLLIEHSTQCRFCGQAGRTFKHGLSRSHLYYIHTGILNRCTNPSSRAWKNYGGRGIGVEPDWLLPSPAGVKNFVDDILRTIGQRPSDAHSLDRKDNARGYFRDNVRWATPDEQAQNKRSRRYIPRDLTWTQLWEVFAKIAAEDGLVEPAETRA